MTRDEQRDLDNALAKGALVNAFGVLAKLTFPLFFLVVTWTLGPATTGVFALAFFAGELLRGLVVGGYMDGVTLYASRALGAGSDGAGSDGVRSERVIGAALATTLALSMLAVAVLLPFTSWVVRRFFSGYHQLDVGLVMVLLALPAMAVLNITLASTKAQMLMHYEVLVNGLARPLLLTASAVIAAATDTGLLGLMAGYLLTHGILAALGLVAMSRCFDLRTILKNMRGAPVPALHRYAIPQSFNLTLNNYQTRVDAWLLGAFSTPATMLGLYTTAALITSALREIRIVFSTSLAPVAARHHAAYDQGALEKLFNRITRWTTCLIIPAVFTVVIFRDDVLVAIDSAYRADTTFMLVLLVAPFTSCAMGLAGNCVGFTGHSRWNLFNAILVSIINTVMSVWLIPTHGLLGAAIGTAVASATLNVVELVEIGALEGLQLRVRSLWQPYAASVPMALLLVLTWDPSDLGALRQVAVFAAGIAMYLAILKATRLPELSH